MKPILSKISVFSATEDTEFQFGAYADIDLVAYIIFKSSDDTVYKFGTTAPYGSGLNQKFVVKANVLQNQKAPYYIMIRCRLTGTNTFSEYSDKVLFYCHEKPRISFPAFSAHTGILQIIYGTNSCPTLKTPSYNFDCNYTYKTSEGEVINRYEYYLYDEDKALLCKSQCLYHRDTMKSFHVDGLDNNATYYLRCKAESIGGYQLDTGYMKFKTKYSSQSDGTQITATNLKYDGSIFVKAKCPASVDAGITHARLKRRKQGSELWMTIYEQTVDLENDLYYNPTWSSGFVSPSGVMTSDAVAVTTEYIRSDNFKSITSYLINCTVRISAYDVNHQFLTHVDVSPTIKKNIGSIFSPTYKKVASIVNSMLGSISSLYGSASTVAEHQTVPEAQNTSAIVSPIIAIRDMFDSTHTSFRRLFEIASIVTKGITWEKKNWNSDYKDRAIYFKVSIIPFVDGVKHINTDYIKIKASSYGYVPVEYTDWYAAGRECHYQYAVAPVVNTMEQEYITTEVVSDFDGSIITDGDTSYHIVLEPKVDSIELNRATSLVETLGNKYPYLYYGNEANYYAGDFSGVGIEWIKSNDFFDKDGGNDYRDELAKWLTNGEAKVLKMSDGREWLMGVNGNVKITCSEHVDKGTLEFSFVEIGDLEDEDDMYSNGLSEFKPVGGTA